LEATTTVDYQTSSSLYNWIIAFNNRHIHLGCTLLLVLALSIDVYTTDRGCPLSIQQPLSSITPLYGKTFFVQNCSYASGSTRIGDLVERGQPGFWRRLKKWFT
jgi:hypothetical protein